jgi:hypothetical protein
MSDPYTRLKIAWITTAENAAATLGEREFVVITDAVPWRVVVHDGVTPGGRVALATEAFVAAQIASLTAGNTVNIVNAIYCT